jgi:hypothetical protein
MDSSRAASLAIVVVMAVDFAFQSMRLLLGYLLSFKLECDAGREKMRKAWKISLLYVFVLVFSFFVSKNGLKWRELVLLVWKVSRLYVGRLKRHDESQPAPTTGFDVIRS